MALSVLRARLHKKNVRTARYVLELAFGKPASRKMSQKAPEDRQPTIGEEWDAEAFDKMLDELTEKYFPKPKFPEDPPRPGNSSSVSPSPPSS